jgi:hypothetical protein
MCAYKLNCLNHSLLNLGMIRSRYDVGAAVVEKQQTMRKTEDEEEDEVFIINNN